MADVSQLTFGVTAVPALGILQSSTENNSAEITEARDENGKVIEQRAYSVGVERQYEVLIKTGTVPPQKGQILTDGEWTGLISSANKTGGNTDYQKYSVTAGHKDNATLIPYDAGE